MAAIDLVTCFGGLPAGYAPEPETAVFRTSEHAGRAGLRRLFAELLAARLPAKVIVINENGDYSWFDYSNWRIIGYFALLRAGLAGPGAVRGLARLALFPFTLLYLMLYAAAVHLRRGCRRLLGCLAR